VDVRASWVRLGVNVSGAPSPTPVDLEALLLETAKLVRTDARLFWGVASWLHVYGNLVDGRLLSNMLSKTPPPAAFAALVIASECPQLTALLRRCKPTAPPLPLFEVMTTSNILRDKVTRAHLPQFAAWGFLVDEVQLRPEALRPATWLYRNNHALLIRAILGAGLRAQILTVLIDDGAPSTASDLARRLGRQYASVHGTLGCLRLSNLVDVERCGNRLVYSVPTAVIDWLLAFPGAVNRLGATKTRTTSNVGAR